jgi:hypothetical protein
MELQGHCSARPQPLGNTQNRGSDGSWSDCTRGGPIAAQPLMTTLSGELKATPEVRLDLISKETDTYGPTPPSLLHSRLRPHDIFGTWPSLHEAVPKKPKR